MSKYTQEQLNEAKELTTKLKKMDKQKKASGRKPFVSMLAEYYRAIKIVTVVLFFTSVVGMGAAGGWYGLNQLTDFWRIIVTFCGCTTAITGLASLVVNVGKVSK